MTLSLVPELHSICSTLAQLLHTAPTGTDILEPEQCMGIRWTDRNEEATFTTTDTCVVTENAQVIIGRYASASVADQV